MVIDFFKQTDAIPLAMSRFGEQEFRDAGLDPIYIPHGIDTSIYTPHDKAEMRQMLGFKPDEFVVGMVANNQGHSPARKAFSEALLAFSIFQQTHEDAILYMHCEMSGFRGGLDLSRLAERFEIPETAIRVTDQVMMEFAIPPGVLAGLYNTFDVLLHPSYGEGFGIPIIEAQACGCPVIVTDWTSMPELVGAGWKVGGQLWDHSQAEAFWMKPDVDEIVGALEDAYACRGNEPLRDKAREFALQYDVDKVVTDHWVPALERIHQPREVKPIGPNRAMRRAMKPSKDDILLGDWKEDIVVPKLVQK
jgi:glycosyltransferase involved in cell wall biosynthesis